MFFYFCKVLFSDFLQFNGNFVDAQNNSKYRDWAPLNNTLSNTWTVQKARLSEISHFLTNTTALDKTSEFHT